MNHCSSLSMRSCVCSLLRLVSCFLLFARIQTAPRKGGNKVLLLLLDGMRWDLFGIDMPALRHVEETGVKLDWLDTVFPTMSSPSMFSIATGLYPESHGVVHNLEFTNTTQITYRFKDAFTHPEWWDQPGAEPIWVTAINQGLQAGCIAYPGGQTRIHGVMPTKHVVYDNNLNLIERIDIALGYLGDDDLDLVFLYYGDPDSTMHGHGINSPELVTEMDTIDEGIGYLYRMLRQNGLSGVVDILITSDHGMVNMNARENINIFKTVDQNDVALVIANYGPLFQVEPAPGKLDSVYQALVDSTPLLHVYKREEMPERFHYGKNSRNLQIIGFTDPGWHVIKKDGEDKSQANHGYDNRLMAMKSILYAQGPSFKQGYRATNMESVNIYPLICELLQLTPNSNNGSRHNYRRMLSTTHTTESTLVLTTMPDLSDVLTKAPPSPPLLEEHKILQPSEKKVVRTLSLLVMSLSILSLLLGVTVLYYCGKHGLCKNGLCGGEQEEDRSHRGFISLVNDFDMDDDSDEV